LRAGWADFPAVLVAKSMPVECLNSKKPHNSSTTYPNATWNCSLESYHLFPYVQKVSKNPQKEWNHNSLTKPAKTHFG
jgi:hypothetical protein